MQKLALLGGSPTFSEKQPIVRPVVPVFSDLADSMRGAFETGMLTKGPFLEEFEKRTAEVLQVEHVVGVSSATIGLMLTYQGLGLKGEVIVPSFTFMATVSSMIWAGLKPVFVECDDKTFNVDPDAVEAAITPRTSAIVAVHNFGTPADLQRLHALAKKHGLKLIMDAAHALGASYQGQSPAIWADAHVYSLSPTKLVVAGEGGLVATNDAALARHIRLAREYGNDGKYDSAVAGLNGRLAEMNALIGCHSLAYLETAVSRRNQLADLYRKELAGVPGIGCQKIREGDKSSYKDFSITVDQQQFGMSRDKLAAVLKAENVDTRNYYDPPVHLQTAYRHLHDGRPLPRTEWLAKASISLPMWSKMDDEIVHKICDAIRRIHMAREQL